MELYRIIMRIIIIRVPTVLSPLSLRLLQRPLCRVSFVSNFFLAIRVKASFVVACCPFRLLAFGNLVDRWTGLDS